VPGTAATTKGNLPCLPKPPPLPLIAALLAVTLVAGCASPPDAPPKRQPIDVSKAQALECASNGEGVSGNIKIVVCVPEGPGQDPSVVLADPLLQFLRASAGTRTLGRGDLVKARGVLNKYGPDVTLSLNGPMRLQEPEKQITVITFGSDPRP
jgi:hypothetical protein